MITLHGIKCTHTHRHTLTKSTKVRKSEYDGCVIQCHSPVCDNSTKLFVKMLPLEKVTGTWICQYFLTCEATIVSNFFKVIEFLCEYSFKTGLLSAPLKQGGPPCTFLFWTVWNRLCPEP